MIPWASQSPQSKRHLDLFSCFRTGDRRVSPYFTMGHPFPLKIAPSHGGTVFAGLTSVTDRPTDHATQLVTIDRIYIRRMGDAV